MIETNPSIAILPTKYRNSSFSAPLYISSYRVTHRNNCFTAKHQEDLFGTSGTNKSWVHIANNVHPRTDYLGFALLDGNLQILGDVTVRLDHPIVDHKYHDYSDYRLFNLHDQIYFTTAVYIGQIELDFTLETSRRLPKFVRLEHYYGSSEQQETTNSTSSIPPFNVYLSTKPSCPVYKESKNLQYFIDSRNQTMVEHYPKWDVNDVMEINLTKPCGIATRKQIQEEERRRRQGPQQLSSIQTDDQFLFRNNQTFRNFHEQRYSNHTAGISSLLLQDRNSACCVRMEHPTTGKEYLVGVVHPKTPFPGKKLPSGLLPNIYLSRFIALEPYPPYFIVARTGSFCFGYPTDEEISHGRNKLLWHRQDVPLLMSKQTFQCPRIHFIMSMIDSLTNPSQVIMSYGVSDCTSRYVAINKSDIQSMLWPSSNASTTTAAAIDPLTSSALSTKNAEEATFSDQMNTTTIPFTTKTAKRDFADQSKFWRYDDAAPPIRYARTHQLASLPQKYRLGPEAFRNLTEYLQQPENQYPQKLHVFETNPSITTLPPRYQIPFNGGRSTYLASYRLLHKHNCFGHTERGLMYGGGDWEIAKKIPRTNYLGLAILADDLTILADVVVLMNQTVISHVAYKKYSDVRLFTIHDHLYLSSSTNIGRLQLQLPGSPNNKVSPTSAGLDGEYVQLEHLDTDLQFAVHLHRKPSCPARYSKSEQASKNLLYFVDDDNNTMVEYWPSSNPNRVRAVDLKKECRRQRSDQDVEVGREAKPRDVNVSFNNFHEERFPKHVKALLTGDRGSACCVRMSNPWTGKEYLVGVVHPETPYPGNSLPKGVEPNMYFSRFFAMETRKPYTIVARTGAFCFGYSDAEEVEGTLLWGARSIPMLMADASFRCPKIHFVMSIVDDFVNNGQVIISYGVSDCTSRFIVVEKRDIQIMLWPS